MLATQLLAVLLGFRSAHALAILVALAFGHQLTAVNALLASRRRLRGCGARDHQ
jgi:hypothetical protein